MWATCIVEGIVAMAAHSVILFSHRNQAARRWRTQSACVENRTLNSYWLLEDRSLPVSRGKYLSLPEARKKKQPDRFAKEHSSEGDADQLEELIGKSWKTIRIGDRVRFIARQPIAMPT